MEQWESYLALFPEWFLVTWELHFLWNMKSGLDIQNQCIFWDLGSLGFYYPQSWGLQHSNGWETHRRYGQCWGMSLDGFKVALTAHTARDTIAHGSTISQGLPQIVQMHSLKVFFLLQLRRLLDRGTSKGRKLTNSLEWRVAPNGKKARWLRGFRSLLSHLQIFPVFS